MANMRAGFAVRVVDTNSLGVGGAGGVTTEIGEAFRVGDAEDARRRRRESEVIGGGIWMRPLELHIIIYVAYGCVICCVEIYIFNIML